MNAFKRIAQQVNFKVERVTNHIYKVHLPGGLQFDSYDHSDGNIHPMSVLKVFDSSMAFCVFPITNESFLELERVFTEKRNIVAAISLKIYPEMYSIDMPKFPLCVTQMLTYVGKSSKKFSSELTCQGNPNVFARFEVQDVILDHSTKKPTLHPDWWLQKYNLSNQNAERPLKFESKRKPISCLEYHMIVLPTDCDGNRHTHWANYGTFCYNACIVLAKQGKYRSINAKSFQNGLKELNITFLSESMELEELVVYSWEAEQEAIGPLVYFDVQNKNGISCCQASISFYHDHFKSVL